MEKNTAIRLVSRKSNVLRTMPSVLGIIFFYQFYLSNTNRNKVKIQGATVYDKVIETFAGAATTFSLDKTPEDTEVHINQATTDDLMVRGQKDLGVLGTDFDYYVDVELKTIVFLYSFFKLTAELKEIVHQLQLLQLLYQL